MNDANERDKAVLTALRKQKARLNELEERLYAPIAITGMGCRFPGADAGPEAYRKLLTLGRDALRDLPDGRWSAEAHYSPDPDLNGAMYTRRAGLLSDVTRFDAAYFGIARREAENMDPQQRLLMEVAYEALEDAQLDLHALRGSDLGVFVGMCTTDYATLAFAPAQLAALSMHSSTGSSNAALAGRLSYLLGAHGPSLVIDTACSSSLVALHLACRSLRARETSVARVAGVNVSLNPASRVAQCKLRALSPAGRSAPFDASADGYVRGEGCGAIVVKRLADALAAGDPILAVVRGSAVQQDGRSAGLTAPSTAAQRSVIRAALADARCEPAEVSYVEAHGTGTPLGDPVELEALRSVYGAEVARARPLALGSVKSNLGHLEGAAGMASLIKVLIGLQQRQLYPSLNFSAPNPNFVWRDSGLRVVTETQPWEANGAALMAGVSGFGFTGTIAHVILAAPAAAPAKLPVTFPRVLRISAKTPAALEAMEERYALLLRESDAQEIGAFCQASHKRAELEQRAAWVIDDPERTRCGEAHTARVTGVADLHLPPRTVLVFSGQGWQRPGMGLRLLERSGVFREALSECDAALREQIGWSVIETLTNYRCEADLARSEILQPVLFATQVALARLLEHEGVRAGAVLGHSLGEISAAHVAGILSLAQAAHLVAARSALAQTKSRQGGMLAVELELGALHSLLREHESPLDIAAHNGPSSTVVAGDLNELATFAALLRAQGVSAKLLGMDVANHSHQLQPLQEPLRRALAGLTPDRARISFYSTVTAQRCDGSGCDAAYWARHLREPVLFMETIRRVAQDAPSLFLEVSGHPVLLHAIEESLEAETPQARAFATLKRGRDDTLALAECAARLWANGALLARSERGAGTLSRALPRYAWDHEQFPLPVAAESALAVPSSSGLTGTCLDLPDGSRHCLLELSQEARARFSDHALYDQPVVPGAFHLARAAAEFARVSGAGAVLLQEVAFEQPQRAATHAVHGVTLRESERGAHAFVTASKASSSDKSWQCHSSGTLRSGHLSGKGSLPAIDASWRAVSGAELRERFARHGVTLGPAFSAIERAWTREQCAVAKLSCASTLIAQPEALRVTVLDACLQVVGLLAGEAESGVAHVPVAIREACLGVLTGSEFWCTVEVPDKSARELIADSTLLDGAGNVLARFSGIHIRPLPRAALAQGEGARGIVMSWQRADLPSAPLASTGSWWIVDAGAAFASSLRAALERAGHSCQLLETSADGSVVTAPGHHAPPTGIVITAADAGTDVAQVARALWTLLASAKLAGELDAAQPPRLWVITEGAQSVAGEPIAVGTSSLWGALRTLLVEHPELRPSGLDFLAARAEQLANVLLAHPQQDHLALRDGQIFMGQLARASARIAGQPAVSSSGVHVISGGLGGLGLSLARQLIDLGAKQLLLLGRSAPSTEILATLRELRALGAAIEVRQLDVADRAALSEALATARRDQGALRGVYHLAATLADALVVAQTPATVRGALHAKLGGALLLDELTRDDALDHFVLYSSAAALLGSVGQANYGAANAALDALAHTRRARGQCATSINWGPVAEVGRAQLSADLDRFRTLGVEPLSLARVRETVAALLSSDAVQYGAIDLDARRFLERTPHLAASSLWSRLRAEETRRPESGPRGGLASKLRALDAEQAQRELHEHLRTIISGALKAPRELVTADKRFGELGMDSMVAMEIKNLLELELGLRLRASLLLSYPTLAGLTRILADQLGLAQRDVESPGDRPFEHQTVEDIAAQLEAYL